MKAWNHFFSLDKQTIQIAVDTEFHRTKILTIQSAVRVGNTIHVQLYCDSSIPRIQLRYLTKKWRKALGKLCKVVVLESRPITAQLSLGRMITDLLQLQEPEYHLRHSKPEGFKEDDILDVEVTWISHYLPADLLRALGSDFTRSLLLEANEDTAQLSLMHRKVLSFSESNYGRTAPIVEYVQANYQLFSLRLRTVDTNELIKGPLEESAKSILGIGKHEEGNSINKTQMQKAFQEQPSVAYLYAIQDVVITLCLLEKLEKNMQRIHSHLGLAECSRLEGTIGSQAAHLLTKYVEQKLNAKDRKENFLIKTLMKRGGATMIAEQSRFGIQTSSTQGGLSYSRSPSKFLHRAKNMFLDVDLSSCYPRILQDCHIYWGKPVVHEPGHDAMTLAEGIKFLKYHAASDDAGVIRVTGALPFGSNVLLRSVEDAWTYKNFNSRRHRRRATFNSKSPDGQQAKFKSCLLTHELNFGVVTAASWAFIQTLPGEIRQEYENLRVESIVFYPRQFVVNSLEEYNELCQGLQTGHVVPWRQEINLGQRKLTTVEDLDDSYVSIRVPMREFISPLIEMRQKQGKATGLGKCMKLLANSMYGILASPHKVCNNIVAANVITDIGRVLALAMHMSLNGIQVITDGVTIRRDQVPAGTLTNILRKHPDYPVKRVEKGMRFLDPNTVPETPEDFRAWYPGHVLRFFGVEGVEQYKKLFSLLPVELKPLPGTASYAFDGIIVDGTANYLKMIYQDQEWQIIDFKARSFSKEQKAILQGQLKEVYFSDQVHFLQPVEGKTLSKAMKALQNICRYGNDPGKQYYFPLGSEWPDLKVYRLIKPSMFLCRDERQRRSFHRLCRKIEKETMLGLEILTNAIPGIATERSLSNVANFVFEHLRADKPVRNLKAHKHLKESDFVRSGIQIRQQRKTQEQEAFARLVIKRKPPLTGLYLTKEEVRHLRVTG